MLPLRDPKPIEINGKKFEISKFMAIPGREIITQYVASGIPKVGEYSKNKEMMLKLMSHVAAYTESGQLVQLTSEMLVNAHIPDWESLAKIEFAMLEYNCSFFSNGRASTFFEGIAQKLPMWITKTLTVMLQSSSAVEKQV